MLKQLNGICKNADIIHHLAGITDVPRVKSESNKSKDKIKQKLQKREQRIFYVL